MNMNNLEDDLKDIFIGYQHRLDQPMPLPDETKEKIRLKYQTDYIFRAKVKSLVAGVMHTVSKHLDMS